MNLRLVVGSFVVTALAACSGGSNPEATPQLPPPAAPAAPPAPEAPPPTGAPMQSAVVRCEPSPRMPVEGRASAYDSTHVLIGDQQALVCYGRPSARGRTMLGGELVPHGRLWRTGANEPTIVHLPVAVRFANIAVEAGSYSLYTVPGEREWTVIVNRSTDQWGHESAYTESVRAQEVGRATVPAEHVAEHVETFTIRSEPAGANRTDLMLEWEHTRVRIPVRWGR